MRDSDEAKKEKGPEISLEALFCYWNYSLNGLMGLSA
jgi:hypothetical protein